MRNISYPCVSRRVCPVMGRPILRRASPRQYRSPGQHTGRCRARHRRKGAGRLQIQGLEACRIIFVGAFEILLFWEAW